MRVYRYIYTALTVEQRPPSIREIAHALKIASSTAHFYVDQIEEAGLITREPGARGIRLRPDAPKPRVKNR